ncbi:oligosaccharide flippase family protein [Vibrio tubiashii]|uniref:oligosaccharide flippase family protein n=1 Tax=Vibrio tubiashii TaxID=29498 RepID=UPI001EFD291C|nr:oligosaccharide flippase family protein [Vibrio tubiashii]MCG9575937.1 oligosaccharide flippase family protein [Vibrio tubiashii]
MKRGLVGNSFIYLFSNILNAAIPFLLLPILTRILDPEGYGMVTMFTMTVTILGAFVGLSVNGAVSVKYFKLSHKELSEYVTSAFLVLISSFILISFVVLLLGDLVSKYILLSKEWILIALLASMLTFVINIRLVLLQVRQKAVKYGIFQISYTLTNIILSLCILYYYNNSWEGRVSGIFIASVIFSVISVFFLLKNSDVGFNIKLCFVKDILKFGIPLIPHAISAIVLVMVDRIIIATLLGDHAVGIYTVGLQLAMGMAIIADAFVKAYGPWIYKLLSREDKQSRQIVVGATYVVFLMFTIIVIPAYLTLNLIFEYLIGEEYHSTMQFIIWFLIGNAFTGMYYAVAGFYFFSQRTGWLSLVSVSSGIFSAVLTYFLVKDYGLLGGAVSFAISNSFMFLLALILSPKVIRLPWHSVQTSVVLFIRELRGENISIDHQ